MPSANQLQIMHSQESRHNVSAKGEAHPAIVLAPILPTKFNYSLQLSAGACGHRGLSSYLNVLIRIAPEQIAQQSSVRHVGGTRDPADLFHVLQIGTQAAMTTENLLVNNGRYGQTIETICERFPQFDIVSSLAFVEEACIGIRKGHGAQFNLMAFIGRRNLLP